ncbi:MAG: DUF7507 domain-containing protein [Christensenellales bacterium]
MRHIQFRKSNRQAIFRFALLAFVCAMFLAHGIAMSESASTTPPLRHILEIKLAVKPVELVAPGDVTLTFSITNASEYDASNLYITSSPDGLYTEPLGQIAAGDTKVFPRPYAISQEQLDAGQINFIVSHDDIASDDTQVNYNVSVPIIKSEAAPNIEFTRQISSRAAVAGDTVIVTYRVKNTGNVALSQIRVRDSLGDFTGRVESLEPGASKILPSRVTLDASAVSEPSVSYVAATVSDHVHTIELSEAPIDVVSESLSASLALDRNSAATGDTVNGVLTIAAHGVGVTGVSVTDDVYGTIIADALEIKAGATITLTYSWPVRASSDYRIRVSGISETKNRIEAHSNTAHVELADAPAQPRLSVAAHTETPEISRAGGVKLTVAIENAGNTPARDITLSELAYGDIHTFAFIPPGEPTIRSVILDVEDDAQFTFEIRGTDASGEPVLAQSAPVDVHISQGGVLPEVVAESGGRFADWITHNVDDAMTYVWMLAIAGAALIALCVVLIATHFRERRQRRQRLEIEKQRRREEIGRTTKFEPIKRIPKSKKRGGGDV